LEITACITKYFLKKEKRKKERKRTPQLDSMYGRVYSIEENPISLVHYV
jgi:hypothetical protein